MGIGQFAGMIYLQESGIQWVLRIYVILLCFLAVLVELEWTKFARESAILKFWITRGLFYCFVGVLGLEQNATEEGIKFNGVDAFGQVSNIVAWMMIGVGLVYSTMGLCCLQFYYNRLRANYEERLGRAEVVREATRNGAVVAPEDGPV